MNKFVKNPLIILAAGVIVVAASGAGATRAALTYSSEAEKVDFSTSVLSVDIQEKQGDSFKSVKEANLSFENIAEAMKTNDSDPSNNIPFVIGKKYAEEVQVVNDSAGNYEEYVRVVVRKSWTDTEGNKDVFLDPQLIKLEVADGWLSDSRASTQEEEIYYLNKPLNKGEAVDFLNSITIDNKVLSYVKTVDGDVAGTVINEYKYDNKQFFVELRVDAVQTHNAKEAILGAWGVNVNLGSNGEITSVN